MVPCTLSDRPLKLLVKKTLLFSCEQINSLYLLWLVWLPLELLARKKETSFGTQFAEMLKCICVYTLARKRKPQLAFSMPKCGSEYVDVHVLY